MVKKIVNIFLFGILKKKYKFLRSLWFFENEKLSSEICRFFGIELIKNKNTPARHSAAMCPIAKIAKSAKSLHPSVQYIICILNIIGNIVLFSSIYNQ